jgi:hypothetical protein
MFMKNNKLQTQIREQMSGPDLHVFTLKFLNLKKIDFSPKITFQMFFLTFVIPFTQLFSGNP